MCKIFYGKKEFSGRIRKSEKKNSMDDNIKFEKDLQLTTCYYTVLLFFAIIALFKIPGINLTNFKCVVIITYIMVGILTDFAVFYQFHIAYNIWKFRDKTGTNNREKKISLCFYTGCFMVLIGLVSFITFTFLPSI